MAIIPVGAILPFAGDLTKLSEYGRSWVYCNGQSLQIAEYQELFKIIGWTYGHGKDPVNRTTFAVPDYRGHFLRGLSEDSGRDPDAEERVAQDRPNVVIGNVVGSVQADSIQSHNHIDQGHGHRTNAAVGGWEWSDNTDDRQVGKPNAPEATIYDGNAILGDPTDSNTGAGTPRHGKETRPKNVAVYWFICAK